MAKWRSTIAAAVSTALLSTSAFAGGGMGRIVYDPTNWAQNLATAESMAKQVSTAYRQLLNQYQQYDTMVRQLQGIDPGAVLRNIQDAMTPEDLANVRRALAAVEDLSADIRTVRESVNKRLDEAKLLKMNWSDYITWEGHRIGRSEEAAIKRVEAERHALERIEKDYAFVREQAAKIPMSAGVHESTQQLNVQMNRLIQQNAEVIRQLALANGSQAAERQLQEAEERKRAAVVADHMRTRLEEGRAAGRNQVRAWIEQQKQR